jgi:hypothetical protein
MTSSNKLPSQSKTFQQIMARTALIAVAIDLQNELKGIYGSGQPSE